MTATCPTGHVSATADYCDRCGALIDDPDEQRTPPSEVTKPGAGATACPVCRTARAGDDRFCETCGHDFGGRGGRAARALGARDRGRPPLFDRVVADIAFPADVAPQRMPPTPPSCASGAATGRRRAAARSPHRRRRRPSAVAAPRRAAPAGGRVLRDRGPGLHERDRGQRPGAAGEPVALGDGDRVHLGAWTGITIRSRGA